MILAPRFSANLGAARIADPRRRRPRASARISAVYTPPFGGASPPLAPSLYDTLGVPLTATPQEIKAAYRRLARTCHPDVGAPADEFMRIHAAYSTLSDPGKRADYDRMVLGSAPVRPQRVQTRPDLDFSGRFSRRRTWETDQCW